MSLTLTNATLLSPEGKLEQGTISLADGKITDIAQDQVIDVQGQLVMPGVIDPHVHSREPGYTYKEDFASMSAAAARGGVTTIFDMPNTNPPTDSEVHLQIKKTAAAKSIVNVKYFFSLNEKNLSSISLVNSDPDIVGVKLYLAESTGGIIASYDVLREALQSSEKVIAIHAEDQRCIASHPERPASCAVEAVEKALQILESRPGKLHICHVSTQEEIALIQQAKQRNLNVTAEVSPHHLTLTRDDMAQQGSRLKVNPPLRTNADRDALWDALADGTIDMIATDHAPHTSEEKAVSYEAAPAGVPGLETLVPVVMTEGLRRGINSHVLGAALSTNAANRFNLPSKGRLQAGYDADITVIDIQSMKQVIAADLKTKCGWSPWEGSSLTGWSTLTIEGGEIVYNKSSS